MTRTKPLLVSATACLLTLVLPGAVTAQVTPEDGDWAARTVSLANTPQAEFMTRVGDIDNLGFGWPAGFDPFSGATTPAHGFPWQVDPADPPGTDRIMVVTSYQGTPPAGRDGYTSSTSRPENSVRPIVLEYVLPGIAVRNAALQLFVDDFQAPLWGAAYEVTLNGHRVPGLEALINQLLQTGPVGKLLTFELPPDLHPAVASGRLEIEFDDHTTGAGDGYAVDFIKLLVNRTGVLTTGSIAGRVVAEATGQPIPNASVVSFDQQTTSDSNGDYLLTNIPAGLAYVSAAASGFQTASRFADVVAGQTTSNINLALKVDETFRLQIYTAVELEFFGVQGAAYLLQYSSDLETWHDDEQIAGNNQWVIRFRSTRPATHRYWRAVKL